MNFSKFSQLSFCHISFELVYSWESYYKNKKGKLFIETQCSFSVRDVAKILARGVGIGAEQARSEGPKPEA